MNNDLISRVLDKAYADKALTTKAFGLEVSRGNIPGFSFIHKYGINEDLNTTTFEDIWDGGGLYNYPADGTAPITHLVSDNAADTEIIQIGGLDIDGNPVDQDITLTGTTPAALDTPLWRVHRLINISSVDIAGLVQITNAGASVVYGQIDNGHNQSLMCLYTIPKGKTGYLLAGGAGLHGLTQTYSLDAHFFIRPFGGVFQLKSTFALHSAGTGVYQETFPIPLQIPEKSDLRVQAISTKNGGSMSASFDLLLVDNVI